MLSMLLLASACTTSPSTSDTKTPEGTAPPRAALPMPPTGNAANAHRFELLNGTTARLSDYLGKVVILDFWATFCIPCREAAPELNALQKQFAGDGLVVIGLNVGGADDHKKIAEFVSSLKIDYAIAIPDPEMLNFFLGSDDKIPQTLVFDRQGRIVKHFVGYDGAVSTQLETTVRDALSKQ